MKKRDRLSDHKLMVMHAWDRQGRMCPICMSKRKLFQVVGHHVINRKDGGADDASNFEARCHSCERFMHEQYPEYGGNYPGTVPFYDERLLQEKYMAAHIGVEARPGQTGVVVYSTRRKQKPARSSRFAYSG